MIDLKKFAQLTKKILGAGLNYNSVVKERGLSIPKVPVVFLKPSSSVIVEGQHIECPKEFEVHHEIELGIIIGQKCKNISPEQVKSNIAGYCLALDLTAVDQMKIARASGLPWTIGKSFDTACPLSRAVKNQDLSNPDQIRLWCNINGETKQNSNTSDMIFNCGQLVSYISKYITLEPYDIILTGSPSGTGPIKSGDTITGGLGDLIKIEFKVK